MLRQHELALVLFTILVFSIGATGHEPKDFTVLLTEDSSTPSSIDSGILVETDSLFFINVDERAGAEHRIRIDTDGDGQFDSSDDISTVWLQGSCELDGNGSKVDEGCMVTASVLLGPQNGLLPGNISMIHQIRIDNSTSESPFYAIFGLDSHSPPTPEILDQDNNDEDEDDSDGIIVLLLVASSFGIVIAVSTLAGSEGEE
jgi:hypothetical protein